MLIEVVSSKGMRWVLMTLLVFGAAIYLMTDGFTAQLDSVEDQDSAAHLTVGAAQ